MTDQSGQELEKFQKHMRSVRNSDYWAALGSIKTDLGLSDKISDASIEALLIYATRDCFKETLDADIVLSAFGLLKGFDNQHSTEEPKDADALIIVRRKMFIKKSSYVADRHGPHNKRRKVHYQSYSELEAAGEAAIDAVLSALGSEDGNLINRVAQKIYSHKRQITSYLVESEEYLDTDDEKNIIGVKLPELIHVNQDESLSAKGSAGNGSQAATGETEEFDPRKPAPEQVLELLRSLLVLVDRIAENYKKILSIIVVSLFVFFAIVALGGTFKYTETQTVRSEGFQEEPQIIQEYAKEFAYRGPLAKEYID